MLEEPCEATSLTHGFEAERRGRPLRLGNHLELLQQGRDIWNEWRTLHPEVNIDLSAANLRGVNLVEADLSGADLSGADPIYAIFSGADPIDYNLKSADLSGANLSRATLKRATLSGANLSEANLSGAYLGRFYYAGAGLIGVILKSANLDRANLSGADLSGADLSGAYLSGANLRRANLKGANLTEANLSGVHIVRGADPSGATLVKMMQLFPLPRATPSGADLGEANLIEATLIEASLIGVNLSGANLSRADLSRAILNGATLVRTNLTDATLTQCSIHGISVWNVQLDGAKQENLVITDYGEPAITVDNLEVAQVIYLLLNHTKLRDVFNAVTRRGVLLLGRFGGGGLEVLQAIAAKLREENYLPIIFDFERPQDRDYTETVKTLAGLARFVIVDLSGPSVPQELSHTVPFFDIPFVPIIEKGRRSYSMFVDLFKYPWVLRPPIEFATVEELLVRMPAEVIAPAEEKHQARQKLLDELFSKA